MDGSVIKVIQINLNKSKLAAVELGKKDEYEVALITEPYTYGKIPTLLDGCQDKLRSTIAVKPRACIRVDPRLKPWLVEEFTDMDMATVAIKSGGKVVYMASIYLDINLPVEKVKMTELIQCCHRKKIPLVMGLDTNSHSPLWGCEETNPRGQHLEEIIHSSGISVLNCGDEPTFQTLNGSSIIDVTMVNEEALVNLNLQEWQVDLTESLSDHKYLTFKFGSFIPNMEQRRNFRKANWEKFSEIVDKGIRESQLLEKDVITCLDYSILQEVINKGLDVVSPLRTPSGKKPCRWWNNELSDLRVQLSKVGDKRRYSEEHHDRYKALRALYRKKIKEAKRESWRSFCTAARSAKDVSTLVKIIQGNPSKGVAILKGIDGYTSTPEESLGVLMETHFPEHKKHIDSESGEGEEPVPLEGSPALVEYVDMHKVKRAI
ncbi:Hypothetical predicted protein, partial [Paramuricea clavata]